MIILESLFFLKSDSNNSNMLFIEYACDLLIKLENEKYKSIYFINRLYSNC